MSRQNLSRGHEAAREKLMQCQPDLSSSEHFGLSTMAVRMQESATVIRITSRSSDRACVRIPDRGPSEPVREEGCLREMLPSVVVVRCATLFVAFTRPQFAPVRTPERRREGVV